MGSDRPPPSLPSSAVAVGMETSAPRAGSQLAATTARHSASYRAEPLRLSSRDELAEMAASAQGNRAAGSRLPGLRKGTGSAPARPGRAPQGAQAACGRKGRPGLTPDPAAPRLRPRSGARLGPNCPGVLSPVKLAWPSGAAPHSLSPETFRPCSRKRSGTLRRGRIFCP